MNKGKYRERYLQLRKEYKNPLSDLIIYDKIISIINNYDLVLIYVSMKDEVDTINIINYCFHHNIKVAIPKCNNNLIDFYLIEKLEDLKTGFFNILEPITHKKITNFENSICITPGIVFDKKGNRIGYGKGYYDKFFSNFNGYKIGIAYKKCITKKLPFDHDDIRVDYIITD